MENKALNPVLSLELFYIGQPARVESLTVIPLIRISAHLKLNKRPTNPPTFFLKL